MASPREVIPIERLRGIHDFPEKAPRGSAEEALNVYMQQGGPSPRGGTVVMRRIAVGADALKGRGLWPWRTTSGALYLVAAYVDTATLEGYIDVMNSGGVLIASFNLSALPGNTGFGNTGGRYDTGDNEAWGATVFQPMGLPFDAGYNALIVGTDAPQFGVAPPRNDTVGALFAIIQSNLPGNTNGFHCLPIAPLDRTGTRYWGSAGDLGVPGNVEADDGGGYIGAGNDRTLFTDRPLIGGRAPITYRGRLCVARLNDGSNRTALRFSNIGDLAIAMEGNNDVPFRAVAHQGWPANNIVWFHDPDPTPLVGQVIWKDFLIVCKSNSLHMCRFSSILDFTVIQQVIGIGVIGPNAMATVHHAGRDILFFASGDGVYAWDGQVRYVSGPIEKRFRKQIQSLGNAMMVVSPWHNQLWIQVGQAIAPSASTSGSHPTWFVFDYRTGDWTEYDFLGKFDAATHYSFGVSSPYDIPTMLARVPRPGGGGGNGLNVSRHNAGNVDTAHEPVGAQVGPETRWQSQRIAYGKHQVRIWRILRLDQQESGSAANVTVYWMLDNQTRAAAIAAGQSTSMLTVGENPGTFGTLTFGNATFGQRGYVSSRIPMGGGPARWMRFGIETLQSTIGPVQWMVNSAEIDTRRKEGRR